MNQKQLKAAMRRMCEADGAVDVLQYLMGKCGYQKPLATTDPQAIIYNEARRDIWLSLREIIPREQLILIENPLKEGDEEWTEREITPTPAEQPLQHQIRRQRRNKEQPQ